MKFTPYRLPLFLVMVVLPFTLAEAAKGPGPLARSKKDMKRLFDVKNAKGESRFYKKFSENARKKEEKLWATLDPSINLSEGTSADQVHLQYPIAASQNEVIVAVIDSGVDINHKDLQGHIWVNAAEFNGIPGVDDDGDGYVDDIYGWNFLGGPDGRNVGGQTLEVTRVYRSLQAKIDAHQTLTAEEKVLYAQVRDEVLDGIQTAHADIGDYHTILDAIDLLKLNGLKLETVKGLDAVKSTDPTVLDAKALVLEVYKEKWTSKDIQAAIDSAQLTLDYQYSLTFDSSEIVKDHPEDVRERFYGNNDVIGIGVDHDHGTHVAGIIAANRDNDFGIDGQARNVKIMSIRAVPDGDERDKDVANAIRFAVDHGARVINMSFGKRYSPNKTLVDEAMKYAEAHQVLLVHAAGNDGRSTEASEDNFPSRKMLQRPDEIATWIEVGASSQLKGKNLAAGFSNYGKTSVDIFAPGNKIVSTVPDNLYASMSGTSMASPEVAGVAALLWERFPGADALDIKEAIVGSTNQYPGLKVVPPGKRDPARVDFADLSVTGGTVNALQAMRWLDNHFPAAR